MTVSANRVSVRDMSDDLTILGTALDEAHGLLVSVRDDQLGDPTPCGDWDVARLAGHLVGTPATFLTMMQGGQPDWSAGPEPVTEGYADRFRADADALLAAWQQADDTGRAGMQTAELAVHAWDLSRALGRPTTDLDEAVAEEGLAFMQANLAPEMRTGAFGPEQPAPEGAAAPDRLAAFAGREV